MEQKPENWKLGGLRGPRVRLQAQCQWWWIGLRFPALVLKPRRVKYLTSYLFTCATPGHLSLLGTVTRAWWRPSWECSIWPALDSTSSLHTWLSWHGGVAERLFQTIPPSFSCYYALGSLVNKSLFICHNNESFQKLKNKCMMCSKFTLSLGSVRPDP